MCKNSIDFSISTGTSKKNLVAFFLLNLLSQLNNWRNSICSMNYYQLSTPFCLFTTSYKSKKRSSDRPPKNSNLIFDEQDKESLLSRISTQEKANPLSCVE